MRLSRADQIGTMPLTVSEHSTQRPRRFQIFDTNAWRSRSSLRVFRSSTTLSRSSPADVTGMFEIELAVATSSMSAVVAFRSWRAGPTPTGLDFELRSAA